MFLLAMFATLRLGAIFVPLNFRLTGPELAFMINDSAAKVLIVDAQLRPAIAPLDQRPAMLAAEDETLWRDSVAPAAAHVPARATFAMICTPPPTAAERRDADAR